MRDEELYTTGNFARLTKTTPRTLRFYDSKGLLKPSGKNKSGYRLYTLQDLEKLQMILLLRRLGLSLEEIRYLLLEGSGDLLTSLKLQQTLVGEKIDHLHRIADTLSGAIRQLEAGVKQSDLTGSLIDLIAEDDQLAEQYKNARNLQTRIRLHSRYSTASQSWFDWVWDNLDLKDNEQILEVGCGNGELWAGRKDFMEKHQIHLTLSDLSDGMVREVRQRIGFSGLSFAVCSAEQIPFRNSCFDEVIANHMLFYLSDLSAGLKEIDRVLKEDGRLIASAYGQNHMHEIRDIVRDFDESIHLSASPLYQKFGLENGAEILQEYFEDVRLIPFEDSLRVTRTEDLAEYILSCHGNQNEKLVDCYPAFLSFLDRKMKEKGVLEITKEAGLFVCSSPRKKSS